MAGLYSGDPGQVDELGQLLPIRRQMRNEDLQDRFAEAQGMGDLAIRQERARALYDPRTGMGKTTNPNISYGITAPNSEIATTAPPSMSPYEQSQIGLKKGELDLEKQKIAQTGKIGEERIGIMNEKNQLEHQKSDQIHDTKMADLQRKHDDAVNKLGLAYDQLQQRGNDANAHLEFLKAKDAADQARHALEITQKDKQIADQQALHQAQIKDIEKKRQDEMKSIGYEYDEKGNLVKKTEQTTHGKNNAFSSSTTKAFTDKAGKKYNIPMDKIDAFKKDNPEAMEVK